MAMVVCPKHGNGAVFVCPHVVKAVLTGGPCPGVEYRSYAAADDPELEDVSLGCWFCPQCVADYQLPPNGTAVANPDEQLGRTSGLYCPICPGCFEDWRRGGAAQGSNQVAFPDPRVFPFVETLEAQWEAVRDEY